MRICSNRKRACTKTILFILFIAGIFFNCSLNIVVASNSDKNTNTAISITLLPEMKIVKGLIKRGDTASSLLNKYLPLKTIYEICKRSSDVFPLTQIREGRPYKIILQENHLVGFEYEINKKDRLVVQKEKDI